MAIVNGKLYRGLQFHKVKGSQEYLFIDRDSYSRFTGVYEHGVGALYSVDTKDPRPHIHRLRVNAGCGFLVHCRPSPRYLNEETRIVSWKKIPIQWREIFSQDLEAPEVWNQDKMANPESGCLAS